MLLLLLLLALVAGAAAFLLFKFSTADGDFTLLSCGSPRREKLDGKVVWITGASRGIGEVLAMQFASFGAKLILSARKEAELDRVKNNIISRHPDSKVELLPMDLSSGEESLKEAVHAAESLFSTGGVDYMIHNAAFKCPTRNALEETEENLKAAFSVDVFGTITISRILAHSMLKRGKGHFVVISSAASKVPAPGDALHSATKSALNGYFASLRSELCTKGIKVTIIHPGAIGEQQKDVPETNVSVERCVELTIVAATHGLKEAWISYQPVLGVMYLVQYMPVIGHWFVDKIGAKRLDATVKKENIFGWNIIFGSKKTA